MAYIRKNSLVQKSAITMKHHVLYIVEKFRFSKCLQRFHLNCGVPQGSCLGPMLFNIYMSGIFDIVQKRLPDVQCYADDSQLYLAFDPNCETSQDEAVKAMERCLLDIKMWAKSSAFFKDSSVVGQNCQRAHFSGPPPRIVCYRRMCEPSTTGTS
jgi:hypothetical protein